VAAGVDPSIEKAIGRSSVAAEGVQRFKDSLEAQDAQRKAILEAKKFRAGDQWPQAVKEQRAGAAAIQGVAAQPARPCLTIDRVSQPVRQVSNAVRQSNFEIDCIPVGDGADKETAEIYKGWMRRIQNEARADAPIEWAADSAAEGGIGWFRLCAFETETDDKFPFDQDLRLDRVTNSLSVYPDPHAHKPTRSDMRFLLQTEDLPRDEAKRKYPKIELTQLDTFRGTGDTGGWVTEKTVRVAEYWRVEYDDVRIVELNNGQAFIGDAIPEGAKKGDGAEDIKRERIRRSPKVRWSKITATQELEKTEWMGTRIPYVPILGEELNVDGKCMLRGVIEPAMDAQRMINYTFSAAIESAALAPKSPWLVAEGQTDQYKQMWQTANTANHSVLVYTPTSLLGQPVGPPQRNSVEQPIQAMVELMVRSEDAVKSTTGIFDPSLGNTNPREKSGTAIKALQDQSAFGQSNYQDNVTRALVYAGELMVELGPKILDRPGRIIQLLQLDDTPKPVMLGQPHLPATGPTAAPQPLMDPASNQPVTDPEHQVAVDAMKAGIAKFYDLKNGKYGVAVSVGRDHITKRQETNSALGDLIPHLPPPMQAVLTPEYIETLDFQGSRKIADICRKAIPPQLQAANGDGPQIPPEVQQQMQQMQQALQQAKQIIDTDKVKNDAAIQKTKLEGTKDILLAQMNNARAILVAEIAAGSKEGDSGELELKSTGIKHAHEAHQAAQDRAHEFRMAQLEHQQNLEAGSVEHAQGLEAAAHQAALEPAPEPAGAGA
jgi:Phage P22-like portal protein